LFGLKLKLMKTNIPLKDRLQVLIFELLEIGDGKGKGKGKGGWRTQRAKVRVRPTVLGGGRRRSEKGWGGEAVVWDA